MYRILIFSIIMKVLDLFYVKVCLVKNMYMTLIDFILLVIFINNLLNVIQLITHALLGGRI